MIPNQEILDRNEYILFHLAPNITRLLLRGTGNAAAALVENLCRPHDKAERKNKNFKTSGIVTITKNTMSNQC